MSVQPITFLTKEEASRITASIRTALDRVSTAWADLAERVAEAFDRRADLALGYPSWAEYAEAELRPPTALAAEVRRELVGLLSARGMSTRAIAPTVGVQDSAVRKDLRRMAGGSDGPTSPAERIDPLTGEIIGGSTIATREGVVIAEQQHITLPPAKVVGLDGKAYTRPTPTKPKQATGESMTTTFPAGADRTPGARGQRAARIEELAATGHSIRQIAPLIGIGEKATREIVADYNIHVPAEAVVKGSRRIRTHEVMENVRGTLEAAVFALELINPKEVQGEQIDSLIQSINTLRRAINRIKESNS